MTRLDYEKQNRREQAWQDAKEKHKPVFEVTQDNDAVAVDPEHIKRIARHAKKRAYNKAWQDANIKARRARKAKKETSALERGFASGKASEQQRIIKLLEDNLGNMTAEVVINLIKGETK